ncbi:MAG: HD domain-containing protein [Clostridia bacterium]|nr:HD domain-containing protein [Clostridia bacterium]
MKIPVPEKLAALAGECAFPLYLVGGSVRDALADFPPAQKPDYDICAAAPEEDLIAAAERVGIQVKGVYRHTGTVKLEDENGIGYEFTRFRSDKYVRGIHTPAEIEFTDDMQKDARRRDFCANAIYYEIKTQTVCDPLDGVGDIKRKILRTVAPAKKVFGEDGLRLMRLARLAAETGFTPDEEAIEGAREHAALLSDIAPERIFTELMLLLHADEKHGFPDAPYRGLCILRETGVLGVLLPELAMGAGMVQRSDFHSHDVLEHSLRCVMYAPKEIRLAALLHDVGKPLCLKRDGNCFRHAEEGAEIAHEILTRLKAPKALIAETEALVRLHMRDYNLQMREGKLRREIVQYHTVLPKLLALKQADFSACKDDLSPAPAVVKWQTVYAAMREEGVPFTVKELAVNGNDALAAGVPPHRVGETLAELLTYCAENGKRNDRAQLLSRLKKHYGKN